MNKLTKEEIEEIRNVIRDNLAQKPNKKDRFYKDEDRNHMGVEFETYSLRDEFSRDSDRILYSKAFRRLQHKAQVYSNKRGDHFRTRLTHTLEVTQIARSIARNLGLNERLTEAIALGHDIGHTPFGHAGEEVLDEIMRGNDDLGGKLNFLIDYGGFKHNFNSINILECVEKRNEEIGLNLSWQTLDGILKHTSIIKPEKNKKWDLKRFVKDESEYEHIISYKYFDDNKPNYEFPLTLEGQVVAIADEIAQREHDLDDGLRNGELSDFDKLFEKIERKADSINTDDKDNSGYELMNVLKSKINDINSTDEKWKSLSNILISYFIIDVTENTMKTIQYTDRNMCIEDIDGKRYITKELVDFSDDGEKFNKKIEELVEKRIINSFNVNRFDGKGKFILRQLFKAYYENPRQMPRKQLIILIKHIKEIINEFPVLKNEIKLTSVDLNGLHDINENNIDFKNLTELLDLLKLNIDFNPIKLKTDNKNAGNSLEGIFKEIGFDFDDIIKGNYDRDSYLQQSFEKLFEYCNKKDSSDLLEIEKGGEILIFCKALIELHYVYLNTICEYISQMTDDYAEKEYQELYLSK